MRDTSDDEFTRANMTFRCPSHYIAWISIAIVSLTIAVTKDISELTFIMLLFGFYCLGSFIAEYGGVSVDATGITLPNRLFSRTEWVVLWRKRFEWKEIERVYSLSDRRAQLLAGDRRGDAIFRNRDDKLAFFKAVKTFQPSLRIQKK